MHARWMAWALVSGALMGLSGLTLGSCLGEPPPATEPDAGAIGTVEQAATGVCDSNPPASTQACINAVQLNGGVVNDIFKDTNGKDATQLPLFGQLFNAYPGCNTVNYTGCSGISNPPYDCPGQYSCTGAGNSFANAALRVNALDRLWWHPCRLTNHNMNGNCPVWNSCTADGVGGNYFPWEGMVFDLGGPSNQVAIFAENDHGPQPCESLEYTVYLTDNPFSKDRIQDPTNEGIDPDRWNRAVLTKIYTKGWVEVRPPLSKGGCGDTAQYSVEEDSFAQVFSLPCGITFRYTSIIAGNDGLDFPECAFDSQEAELDAVAGLTESGAGVCPDDDEDHFVDCNCPGAPPICDCNDLDPQINPGEPEPCDSPDVNCDGIPGSCTSPLICYNSLCLSECLDESASCPTGSSCQTTPKGNLCVPDDCSVSGCPPGSICNDEKVCVPACTDVVCPGDWICQDGHCLDPCQAVQCPSPQVCQGGQCVAPCDCYKDDIGCIGLPGTVCDKGGSNLCVPPKCKGVMCLGTETCDPTTGMCIPFCHPGVKCPKGQKCVNPDGCVPLCEGVTCPDGFECNPETGKCEDHSCDGVTCFPPLVCENGECVDPGTGGGGGGEVGQGGNGGGATVGSGGSGTSPERLFSNDQDSSCGCEVPGHSRSNHSAAWLLFAFALSRRRRSASSR